MCRQVVKGNHDSAGTANVRVGLGVRKMEKTKTFATVDKVSGECPYCKEKLELGVILEYGNPFSPGYLTCKKCKRMYPFFRDDAIGIVGDFVVLVLED